MSNVINIGYAVSNKYVGMLAISIASIITNSPNLEFNFYILNSDISLDNRRKINKLKKIKNFNIEYIQINNDDFKNMSEGISVVSNYRLKISTIKKDLDKILFLDSDIISVGDISELYNIDLDDNYIAAVVDPGVKLQYEYTIEDKEKFPDRRFNTGVMLANLKKWREDKIEEKILDGMIWYAKKYKNWPDQNVLNMVFKDKILEIPYIYNFCPILYQQGWYEEIKDNKIDIEKIKVVHFAGVPKPWETTDVLQYLEYVKFPYNTNKENLDGTCIYMNDIFWEYAKLTAFYEDYLYEYINKNKLEKAIKLIIKVFSMSKILSKLTIKYNILKLFALNKKHYKNKLLEINNVINFFKNYK